jgi:FkbM family methyltransferase
MNTDCKKPSICLNMIVKNESHIIQNTLEKLCEKINFSYWVICDTGSDDNTPEIIKTFFKNKNIPGELHNDEWKNFAHNRTLALNYAFSKTDLLLIFDADDEIVGNIEMPSEVLYDEYHLQFGSFLGPSYTRALLINNHKRYKFESVLHEYIRCMEPYSRREFILGNYYIISGRSGSRSQDPKKYLKDAQILEEAYYKAVEEKEEIYKRYAFYCANSYRDYGDYENALKWYKITIGLDTWEQEQYISCISMFDCYSKLKQNETGFFYLVKALKFDSERVEAMLPLIIHYCCENQPNVAYNYYLNIKDFYENRYLSATLVNKLFIDIEKFDFLLPYYMIIVSDRIKNYACGIKMFEIIFTKKIKIFNVWFVKNLLFNLQFFMHHINSENINQFIILTNEYIRFLHNNNVQLNTFDYLKEYNTRFGLDVNYIFNSVLEIQNVVDKKKFSNEECKNSKNILIYTGFCDILWNYSYMINNALGGSEKAVNYLSKSFPKEYTIYVAGSVENETNNNVIYINFNQISTIINTTPFNTIICSRYIAFLEMFKECCYDQFYIWAHDTHLIHYGCDLDVKSIISKYNDNITGCICLTNWHSELFKQNYPELSNKIYIINNGVNIPEFKFECKKQPNKFIYSSRPERGLEKLLNLWPQILNKIPDATLVISSYGDSPPKEIIYFIEKYDSIKFLGKLNSENLYYEMSTAEYWLYPTPWPETSCITSLEMLMSEVICLYYPIAGLNDTVGDYGIKVMPDNEIDTIMSLTEDQKDIIRKRGKEYAISCSWDNRVQKWLNILFDTKNINKYDNVFDDLYDDNIYEIVKFNKEQTAKFKIYKNCYICKNSIRLNKIWEPELHEVFEKYITPESVVIEGGCHIGTHTIKLGMMAKKVYAFEPHPCSNNLLNININLNNLKNVTTFKKGLSDKVGITHFAWSPEHNPGGSGLADNPQGIPHWSKPPKNKINVELTTIDFLNLDRLDFIKLDVEGYEELVIKGGINTILKFKPIIIMECYKNHNVMSISEIKEMYSSLFDAGYSVKQLKITDFLFINENKIFENNIRSRIYELHKIGVIPKNHVDYLKKLAIDFEPKIVYDIGANVLSWTREARKIWPNSEVIVFDAISTAEFFYKENNLKYHIGILSKDDNSLVKFYENIENPAGNSYYKEIGHSKSNEIYPDDVFTEQKTFSLSSVVSKNNFQLPDLIKIDVQGAELDIIKGGLDIINNAKYLIVELQDTQYNRGAPLADVTIKFLEDNDWELIAPKFCDNGPDADYCFKNKRYDNKFTIKIINLNRRPDRKKEMTNKMEVEGIKNYEFVEATDGKNLEPSLFIKKIFKGNNFNYRKGIIGCALSHYYLWHKLLNDNNNNYYVILEDDVYFVKNFNEKIQACINIVNKNNIEYALIGGYTIYNECSDYTDIHFDKITDMSCSGTYGYIISKTACYKLRNYIKTNGIKYAIDYSLIYTSCLDMYKINNYLVSTRLFQDNNKRDTDIQLDLDFFKFDSTPSYQIAFTDWWIDEYCGGIFNQENNFLKNMLSKFYNISIVKPEENPDILFYSVFGNNHKNIKAKRKIFYSGEPHSQREDADFNITFDKNSDKNCRLPLWVFYLDNILFDDCYQKKTGSFKLPNKPKFCSIICQTDSKNKERSEIINKLSKYKQVDCGGSFLNNIGYIVPRGTNCSGKIKHNNNYKFVLAIENTNYPGYVTEKICDVYKSKCIPIYWGSNEVITDFNPKTFINANDFSTFDELVEYIQKVDNDNELYKSYFTEPIFSNYWLNIFYDINELFFSDLAKSIVGNINNNGVTITIGFHSNQLCERGTEVAMYDYAYYNQEMYNNKSVIFYCKHNPNNDTNVIKKFEKQFKCYGYNKFSDIEQIIKDEKIDYFYNCKSGNKNDNQLIKSCPNLIHAVFTVEPHGEKYATISKQLSEKYNNIVDYVPHMINLPKCEENMRQNLNIPNDAIVIGRYGGYYQFNIQIAHNAIKSILDIDDNIYFILANTNIFYKHPRILYLDRIIDLEEKVKFINTCDAMIHARSDGETFGLAIGEFSSCNKPIITCRSFRDDSHIEILGEKGIIYTSEESLIEIFKNIKTIIKSRTDWNAYTEYSPEKVMKKFYDVFIYSNTNIN